MKRNFPPSNMMPNIMPNPIAPVQPMPAQYCPPPPCPPIYCPPQAFPAQYDPPQQYVKTNLFNKVVSHVHPSHTTTVNKLHVNHQHFFP
ncbi:CotD family spore coat protein [Neobacillus pocheonensis]|uniref:CotD family spore coat protein n=1 Tax=Neobacillus pocheonensis TaxID=363869 RepID=A0ABT0WE54_9BACI|nr:CotD family spore coat protein [Neobacillus pocheonensis]